MRESSAAGSRRDFLAKAGRFGAFCAAVGSSHGRGGFLFGKDAALLLEGFATPAGAAFQMEALQKVSQAPAAAALDTHYHYDHSMGNSFYGAHGIQLWGHAAMPGRIT